ncbi:MAG: ATP-binding cassette domain-containing protein, partial [Microthrixaceae bacterium]
MLLSCAGLTASYGRIQALFGVDLEVAEGEIVALLGTNGAGKTTLFRTISQVIEPDGGTIAFAGREITHAGPRRVAESGITQVPGGRVVFPTMSVADHFVVCRWPLLDTPRDEIDARVDAVREQFPQLAVRWHESAGNLSGGEQQQLGMAMALVTLPRLLLIDELSLGLAPSIVEQMLGVIRSMNEAGTAVLLIEQSLNIAVSIAQRCYFMENGVIRFSGPTKSLLERPDLLQSAFLRGTRHRGARGADEDDPTLESPGPVDGSGDRDDARSTTGHRALSVQGLTRRYGGVTAVGDVSFELAHGEILGLIGPNGAGKTTILDLISGLTPSEGGRVELDGIDLSARRADQRAEAGLGRTFQDAHLFPTLTVAETIALGGDRHHAHPDHFATLLALPAVLDAEREIDARVDELIELFGLAEQRNRFVGELSTGTRRVVEMAAAIAHAPTVLLLDEPSSGL